VCCVAGLVYSINDVMYAVALSASRAVSTEVDERGRSAHARAWTMDILS